MEESRQGIQKGVDLFLTEPNSSLGRYLVCEPTQIDLSIPALKVNCKYPCDAAKANVPVAQWIEQ